MFKELLDYLAYKCREIVTSRLFPLVMVFLCMFGALYVRMYKLQIVEGDEAEKNVKNTTVKTVYTSPTRGNIYDSTGTLLAYNKLVQNVTVIDDGSYRNGYERNHMLLELIRILDRYGETVEQSLPIYYDEHGELQENFASENARLRFLRDMYGKTSVTLLSDEQKAATKQDILEFYMKKFGVGVNADKTTYEVEPEAALKCLYIRYSMYSYYYVRYNAAVVARNVKDETVAAIREHAASLRGVDIGQSYTRVYNDPEYFCHILGYTGAASADEIEALNEQGGDYVSGDIIGKAGIESSMELYLHGTSGSTSMYVNNYGQIQQIIEKVDPEAGNDIYLSIDATLQKGIYHLIEQKLAGILVAHLKNEDVDPADSDHYIPIKQAYYQLISNNVLSIAHFASEEAGEAEKRLYEAFADKQAEVLAAVEDELLSLEPAAYRDLPEDMQTFLSELYSVLQDKSILIRSNIDTASEMYQAYRVDGSVSLEEYLRYALEAGWVDVTLLKLDDKYSSTETVYRRLVELILESLEESDRFSFAIYKKLIYDDAVSRCDIGLALFEQGALKNDPEYIEQLRTGNSYIAFKFLSDKIASIEITPAQLALDPYSGAATVTDAATGKVLAMVSYPGYDNNRISESSYYRQLLNDQSTPLYGTATQARTTPGSIFKLVTTAAALETGTMTPDTYLTTHGSFTGGGITVKCWCYPANHGDLNLHSAIMASCNDFFCQVAYRFSQVDGVLNDSYGISILRKYAGLLGLAEKSGVEIVESMPFVTDTSVISSAIGHGTNLYANSQLARYATTIATRGNVYDLTLLDRRTDAKGTLIQSYRGELVSKTEFNDLTWDTMHLGMHLVVQQGSISRLFSGNVDVAAKTGTAIENINRPDHATFISFAPYSDPEISVAVTIPHGYTSGNTAEIGAYIYDYYYGHITYDDIIDAGAKDIGGNDIHD